MSEKTIGFICALFFFLVVAEEMIIIALDSENESLRKYKTPQCISLTLNDGSD